MAARTQASNAGRWAVERRPKAPRRCLKVHASSGVRGDTGAAAMIPFPTPPSADREAVIDKACELIRQLATADVLAVMPVLARYTRTGCSYSYDGGSTVQGAS